MRLLGDGDFGVQPHAAGYKLFSLFVVLQFLPFKMGAGDWYESITWTQETGINNYG